MGETDWGGKWAVLSKFLIQFSVDGRGFVPSLLFDLRPNYGGGKEEEKAQLWMWLVMEVKSDAVKSNIT